MQPTTDPINAMTGQPYTGNNITALLGAQHAAGYASAMWLTFRQARMLGGTVNKGEHGTRIVRVVSHTAKDEDDAPRSRRRTLKHYTVFNVAQCRNLHELDLDERAAIEEAAALGVAS